jgi:hypothetical protein
MLVKDALARYFAINGFTTAAYTAPTVEIPIGPFTIPLPNTEGRKAVVKLHDLHHLATGYGTDLTGEAEIGAWELRAGCRSVAAYVYNGMAVAMGLLISPIRTTRAFLDARGSTTLYRLGLDYDAALELDLLELRRRMGVDREGMATRYPVRLHGAAPKAPSTATA